MHGDSPGQHPHIMKMLDQSQQTELARLLTEALRSARMERAGFGFPNDRIEVASVHMGETAGIREGDVLHPTDYVRTITAGYRHSWIATPIEAAMALLGIDVPPEAQPESMPPRTRRTAIAVGAGQVVDAEFVAPAAPRPHPHADLIARWLPDTTQPLWLWNTKEWVPLPGYELLTHNDDVPPAHLACGDKPTTPPRRMCTLAGVDFPEPETAAPQLGNGTMYYCAVHGAGGRAIRWDNDDVDQTYLTAGLVHLSREAAHQHHLALTAATKQAIEAAR